VATAPNPLQTSLTASFDDEASGGSGELSLSAINYPVGVDGVAVKLVDTIPTGFRVLRVTFGTVSEYANAEEHIPERIEIVQGVEKIETPYLEAISFITAFSDSGAPVTPALTRAPDRKSYTVAPKVWGLITREAYVKPFIILKYVPQIIPSFSLSALIKYGTVAVIKNKRVAIHNPDPLDVQDTDNVAEVYKITSEMVVDDEGEWEKPNGWPDNPSYPGNLTPKPQGGTGVIVQRVHEMCVIGQTGISGVRTYYMRNARPYLLDTNYKPIKTLQEGAFGQMSGDIASRARALVADRKKRPL